MADFKVPEGFSEDVADSILADFEEDVTTDTTPSESPDVSDESGGDQTPAPLGNVASAEEVPLPPLSPRSWHRAAAEWANDSISATGGDISETESLRRARMKAENRRLAGLRSDYELRRAAVVADRVLASESGPGAGTIRRRAAEELSKASRDGRAGTELLALAQAAGNQARCRCWFELVSATQAQTVERDPAARGADALFRRWAAEGHAVLWKADAALTEAVQSRQLRREAYEVLQNAEGADPAAIVRAKKAVEDASKEVSRRQHHVDDLRGMMRERIRRHLSRILRMEPPNVRSVRHAAQRTRQGLSGAVGRDDTSTTIEPATPPKAVSGLLLAPTPRIEARLGDRSRMLEELELSDRKDDVDKSHFSGDGFSSGGDASKSKPGLSSGGATPKSKPGFSSGGDASKSSSGEDAPVDHSLGSALASFSVAFNVLHDPTGMSAAAGRPDRAPPPPEPAAHGQPTFASFRRARAARHSDTLDDSARAVDEAEQALLQLARRARALLQEEEDGDAAGNSEASRLLRKQGQERSQPRPPSPRPRTPPAGGTVGGVGTMVDPASRAREAALALRSEVDAAEYAVEAGEAAPAFVHALESGTSSEDAVDVSDPSSEPVSPSFAAMLADFASFCDALVDAVALRLPEALPVLPTASQAAAKAARLLAARGVAVKGGVVRRRVAPTEAAARGATLGRRMGGHRRPVHGAGMATGVATAVANRPQTPPSASTSPEEAAATAAVHEEARKERMAWRVFIQECVIDAVLCHVYEPVLKACMRRWSRGDAVVDELAFRLQAATPADLGVALKYRLDGSELIDSETRKVVAKWRHAWLNWRPSSAHSDGTSGGPMHQQRTTAAGTGATPSSLPSPPLVTREERLRRLAVASKSYSRAAGIFRTLLLQRTPRQKCATVAAALQAVCDAPVSYYAGRLPPKKATMGADDLVDAFAFVVIQSHTASLVSQLGFIETFLPARLRIGADGFALTNLYTATSILRARATVAWNIQALNRDPKRAEQAAFDSLPDAIKTLFVSL